MFNSDDYKPYIDHFGMLTQKSPIFDGGDSTHRFATAYIFLKLSGSKVWLDGTTPLDEYYIKAMRQYETDEEGVFRRHPDPSMWYSEPNNFSRDQMTMLENAFIIANDEARAEDVSKQMIKRRGFHQNIKRNYNEPGDKMADFTTPSEIAALIRGNRNHLMTPLLLVLDLFYVVDVVLAMYDDYKSKKKGKRTDAYTMLATNLVVAKQRLPTPGVRIASELLSLTDYKGAIEWIFNEENNDAPLDKIMLPVCEEIL